MNKRRGEKIGYLRVYTVSIYICTIYIQSGIQSVTRDVVVSSPGVEGRFYQIPPTDSLSQ